MLELKNDYSITKIKNGLTEFEERKLITWIEYKNSFKGLEKLNKYGSKIRNNHDKKQDEKNIAELFIKGDKIQNTLNKNLDDFDTYKQYLKTILFAISLQNDIIREIETYIEYADKMYGSMLETKKIAKNLIKKLKKKIKKEVYNVR